MRDVSKDQPSPKGLGTVEGVLIGKVEPSHPSSGAPIMGSPMSTTSPERPITCGNRNGPAPASLDAIREAARAALAEGNVPDFLADLERIRTDLLLQAARPPLLPPLPPTPARTRLLSVKEVAALLGRSKSWVYKNRSILPIVRFPTGGYGFNAERIDRWIKVRTNDER